MAKYIKWVMLTLMMVVAAGGIWAVTNPKTAMEMFTDMGGIEEGQTLPLVAGEEVASGSRVSLKDYAGKRYIAMAAKIDCTICQSTYPFLGRLKEEYPNTQFVMIGQGEKDDYAKVKQEHKFQFPLLYASPEIQEALNFKAFPTFYLVNEKGEVEERMIGFDEKRFDEMMKGAEL